MGAHSILARMRLQRRVWRTGSRVFELNMIFAPLSAAFLPASSEDRHANARRPSLGFVSRRRIEPCPQDRSLNFRNLRIKIGANRNLVASELLSTNNIPPQQRGNGMVFQNSAAARRDIPSSFNALASDLWEVCLARSISIYVNTCRRTDAPPSYWE